MKYTYSVDDLHIGKIVYQHLESLRNIGITGNSAVNIAYNRTRKQLRLDIDDKHLHLCLYQYRSTK